MQGAGTTIWIILEAVLFGLAYFGCAEISHLLSFSGTPFATIWLSGGLFMAVLARVPDRRWPEIVGAAIVANLVSDVYFHEKSFLVSGIFCVGNTLEAVVGALLIRQVTGSHHLPTSVVGVVYYVLVGPILATTIGATIGAATIHVTYQTDSFFQVWTVWWAADALGVLIVCPCVLSWLPPEEDDIPSDGFGWWSEAAPVFALASVTTALIFLIDSSTAPPLLRFTFWLFPIVIWAAVRLGVCGASTTTFVIALVAVLGTTRGWGPFAHVGTTITEHAIMLQAFQSLLTFVALSLAAILAELKLAREDVSEKHNQLLEANRRLESLAETDGLTGVKNRRAFDKTIDLELARSRRAKRSISLLLLDVDSFKEFNDTYGHLAGDSLLKELAQLIDLTVRKTDQTARYGGEEFAIILPDTDAVGAVTIAERLREDIESHPWPFRSTTVSIGIATSEAGLESAGHLVAMADAALYYAKDHGKNCVIHSADLQAAREAGELAGV